MIIGIAGGIGSGKSLATAYLEKRGFSVIDADKISRALTAKGQPAAHEIAKHFGSDFLSENGELDRKKLAATVFSDADELLKLNAIMHKYIEAEVVARLIRARQESDRVEHLFFLSAPLFFEANYQEKVDEVWLITAPEDLRIKRAAARDGSDTESVRLRIRAQMSEDERRSRSDLIIDNSGSEDDLYDALKAAIESRLRK